jgi:hypothetical protein
MKENDKLDSQNHFGCHYIASNVSELTAVMPDSIGITKISYQDVPVTAMLKSSTELSGVINFLPADVNVFVDKLKNKRLEDIKYLTSVELQAVSSGPDAGHTTPLIRVTEMSHTSLYYSEKTGSLNINISCFRNSATNKGVSKSFQTELIMK